MWLNITFLDAIRGISGNSDRSFKKPLQFQWIIQLKNAQVVIFPVNMDITSKEHGYNFQRLSEFYLFAQNNDITKKN